MNATLFIGGPADGEWIRTDGAPVARVPEPCSIPMSGHSFEPMYSVTVHEYHKLQLHDYEGTYWVYVHSTIGGGFVKALIDGYTGGKPRG